MDLTAVHDILLKTGYKDEEGAENEVSHLFIQYLVSTRVSVSSLEIYTEVDPVMFVCLHIFIYAYDKYISSHFIR